MSMEKIKRRIKNGLIFNVIIICALIILTFFSGCAAQSGALSGREQALAAGGSEMTEPQQWEDSRI